MNMTVWLKGAMFCTSMKLKSDELTTCSLLSLWFHIEIEWNQWHFCFHRRFMYFFLLISSFWLWFSVKNYICFPKYKFTIWAIQNSRCIISYYGSTWLNCFDRSLKRCSLHLFITFLVLSIEYGLGINSINVNIKIS